MLYLSTLLVSSTLEEYSHIMGIEIKDQVPFNSSKELPKFHQIFEVLHLGKKDVEINLKPKGILMVSP